MANLICSLCGATYERESLEEHIAESHSDLTKQHDGVSEAEWLRQQAAKKQDMVDNNEEADPLTVIPTSTALDAIGVKLSDVADVTSSVNSGAAMTAGEAKLLFNALETLVGFRINRASVLVNLVHWGLLNGFSEELAEAGGFTIEPDATVSATPIYKTVDVMHTHINEYFGARSLGRIFTFRRFGRFLGPEILKMVDNHPVLGALRTTGTPMSNRLGVAPVDFLAVSSIFEYIKSYTKWSSSERAAWNAHNASVVKIGNQNNAGMMPMDLRPSPSQAGTLVEENLNDFGRNHYQPARLVISNKGASLYDKMTNNSRSPGDVRGVGY